MATRSSSPDAPLPADLPAWLHLCLTQGVGPTGVLRLLRGFGSPAAALNASHDQVSQVIGAALAARLLRTDNARDAAVAASLAWAGQPGHRLLTLADPDYPARLLEIPDPPPLLHVSGQRLDALGRPALAIVGSRHATRAGLANARAFANLLAAQGITIVSGLALGIDAAAHQGALDAPDGLTVAVMGTGADRIYPAGHRPLAHRVVASGLLVSEAPLGSPALRGNFPRRNRLIAGLSLGVLVVEAARQSGSLITARLALEAGREVFAIPGSIHSPVSRGCHHLIRDGAKLVEQADDILAELPRLGGFSPARPSAVSSAGPADPDQQILLDHLGWDPVSVDLLSSTWPGEAPSLAESLLKLELAGTIERLPDGRVQRVPAG
ncbi:MAG: DNA-processing protein DprA [Burkholderiaceae bacterium]